MSARVVGILNIEMYDRRAAEPWRVEQLRGALDLHRITVQSKRLTATVTTNHQETLRRHMPTVGWILEGNIDRFLAGTTIVPDPGPARPPLHYCPFCESAFESVAELGQHLGLAHVGARPFLTIDGAEPGSQDIIRRALQSPSIGLFSCTAAQVSLDGVQFKRRTPAAVRAILSETQAGRVWLRIQNKFEKNAAPINTEYDLRFRIATPEQLEDVDHAFIRHLGRADPTVAHVGLFLEQSARDGAAEYAAALGDYVIGVLIKDGDRRAGVRSGARDHRRKLNSALRTLQSYDRPLAHLLSALIRLSANDFSAAHRRSGYPPLDEANAILGPLAGRGAPELAVAQDSATDLEKLAICPVDNGSDAIMRRAAQLRVLSRWSQSIEDQLRAESDLQSLDPLDRVKLQALWASAALGLGKPERAVEPLRLLAGNDCFGEWAASLLKEYDA